MDYYHEVLVSLSVIKSVCCAPWRRTDDDVVSEWQKNLVISETMHDSYKVTMDHYQEVFVDLSESVVKFRVTRPLADKSR